MGVHTGDSITVAPAQTLSRRRVPAHARRRVRLHPPRRGGDRRQQRAVRRAPRHRRAGRHRDEPARVARRARWPARPPGFPIAKIAARLAVGYTLDEIPNDITRMTPASFEPTIDYVVTKIPRWAFEKLPGHDGGARHARCSASARRWPSGARSPRACRRACGRWRPGRLGLDCDPGRGGATTRSTTTSCWRRRHPDARAALPGGGAAAPGRPARAGCEAPASTRGSSTRCWPITEERAGWRRRGSAALDRRQWRRAKRLGFSDAQLAYLWGVDEAVVRAARLAAGVRADVQDRRHVRRRVRRRDAVPLLDVRGRPTRCARRDRPRVVILGSGPNRIGQGIEFDYCCVHASFALRDAGYETVMVNCNPETVSTDYDTCDRLYFEPLTHEDVLNVIESEQPGRPVIVVARRADAAQAGRADARRPRRRHEPRVDRPGRGPRALERAVRRAADPAAAGRHGRRRCTRRWQSPSGSGSRCWSARATSSGAGHAHRVRPRRPGGGDAELDRLRLASAARAGSRRSAPC